MRGLVVTLGLLLVAGCSSDAGFSADEWLGRLQEENAFVCGQAVCDTAKRRAALASELATEARAAGEEYRAIAVLAERVELANLYWEVECYPSGSFSASAGMSCADAFDLSLGGTRQLEGLVRRAAVEQQRR